MVDLAAHKIDKKHYTHVSGIDPELANCFEVCIDV